MIIESIESLKKDFEEVREKQSILQLVLFLPILVLFVVFLIARFFLGDELLFRPDVLLFSLNLFLVFFFVVFVLIIFLLVFDFKSRSIGKEVVEIIKQTYHLEKLVLFPKIELTGEGDLGLLSSKIEQIFISLKLSQIRVDKNKRIITAYKNLSSTGFLSRINFFLFLLRRTLIQRISVVATETSPNLFKLGISVSSPFPGFNYYLLKQIEAEILKEGVVCKILSSSEPFRDEGARKGFVRRLLFIFIIFFILPLIFGIYNAQVRESQIMDPIVANRETHFEEGHLYLLNSPEIFYSVFGFTKEEIRDLSYQKSNGIWDGYRLKLNKSRIRDITGKAWYSIKVYKDDRFTAEINRGKEEIRFLAVKEGKIFWVEGFNQFVYVIPRMKIAVDNCGREGQTVGIAGSPDTCCEGLKGFWSNDNDDCNSPSLGGLQVCSDCGNGTCEQKNWENKCNCPQDCQ